MRLFLFVCIAATLAGCVTPPKSADELRKMVNANTSGTGRDTFTVRRPFHQVASVMKSKWAVCLDQTITRRYPNGNGGYSYDVIKYNPTASGNGHHMRLLLQWNRLGRKAIGPTPPPGGFYQMVVDVDAVNGRSTKIDAMSAGAPDNLMKQVKLWAEGTSTACPDLTE